MSVLEPLVVGRDYRLRAFVEADRQLVRDSWRRSYSGPWSDFARAPTFDAFMRGQSAAMDHALASSEAVIACAPDLDDQILGWICFRRPDVLHYLFVKTDFRGHGLGGALFAEAFPPSVERIYSTHIHTIRTPTRLVVRKLGDDRIDRDHPVPAWFLFGRRLTFSPWMIFAPTAAPATATKEIP
jgi:GNAT superfamily N-acetyltransferase